MTKIEKLLRELLGISSVSGNEGDILSVIENKANIVPNVSIVRQKVNGGKFNLIIRKGNSKKWIVAHVDTVPGSVVAQGDMGKIYGRGACDNKQSVAAALILLEELPALNVLFTVGEEVDFCGAITAQKSGLLNDASLVIVQEPTDFKVITGQRGLVIFKISVQGVKQHSSLDNPKNAIVKLSKIVTNLDYKKFSGFNAGIVSGGVAENIVADNAVLTGSIRPDNQTEFEDVMSCLKKLNSDDVVVDILKSIQPSESSIKFPRNIAKHFSEMGFFPNTVQFGAGKIELAHTDNEYIDKKDLEALPGKLKEIIA